MAKNQKDRQHRKQKELAKRNKKRTAKRSLQNSGKTLEPSNKVARKLAECYELVETGYLDEAKYILDHLVIRNARVPAVIETQMMLYQELGDHSRCCSTAKRLLELTPRDPYALLMYAQESMLCGRASIAFLKYREFLQRFPDHENSSRAKIAIDDCEQECHNRVNKSRADGFHDLEFEEGGLELFARHEDSLAELQAGNFDDGMRLCHSVLKEAPRFLSARNNLASCCFQSGELSQAVDLARETCELAPDNRYAQANLIKLEFLTGNIGQSNRLADRLMADPPTEQDSIAAASEALSFLGRDKDVVTVAEIGINRKEIDKEIAAAITHHLAVAHFRLGDEKAARLNWKKCLQHMPNHFEARANLDDLETGKGHAPWPEPIGKWLPQAVLKKALSGHDEHVDPELRLLEQIPSLAALIPALLDRGDPTGRKFALELATMNLTPEIIESLSEFGTGQRGPSSMRHQALIVLHQNDHCDAGPHRFFSRGQWTEVQLFNPEITDQPTTKAPAWKQKLMKQAHEAMNAEEFGKAESIYQEILQRDPDSYTTEFNLATVWSQRDGKEGQLRAEKVITRLHREHPDYIHAIIAMAQFASIRDDSKEAARLLAEVMQQRKMHISEATALFVTQAQIALDENDIPAAEHACDLLAELCGEDDRVTAQIRDRIDLSTTRRGFLGLNPVKNIF